MKVSSEGALIGNVVFPSYDEQTLIADYFNTLDKKIQLEEQKLESLKRIKSACLDNMFV
jgi:type I restriction enzyme S subunit